MPDDTHAHFAASWTVDDAEVAELLMRPESFRFLAPFLARSVSASQAARELQVSLPRLRYWVLRARELGLLVTTEQQQRNGRTLKLYRTRADTLYLPAAMTEDGTFEALVRWWSAPFDHLFLRTCARLYERAGARGLRLFRDDRGRVDANLALSAQHDLDRTDPRLPPTMGGWVIDLTLSTEDARALQAELVAIKQRYVGRPGSRRFMMRLALAPLEAVDSPL